MAYEEAIYTKVYKNNFYEVRNYSNRLAIQFTYTDQDNGFQKLFKYISGENFGSKKINMITPVIESTNILMKIPAIQSNDNETKIMQFLLPSNLTKENAPLPLDKELKLVTIQEGYYAVIKYSGRLTNKNFDKYKKILKDNLIKDNINILSSAIKATYNSPFTLPFLRRNEVMFLVIWED